MFVTMLDMIPLLQKYLPTFPLLFECTHRKHNALILVTKSVYLNMTNVSVAIH